MKPRFDGFFPDGVFTIEGAASGPLRGCTFAAKDVFDVAGHPTSAGNPDWRRTRGVAARTAPSVRRLLDAGATFVGKTMTDEMCASMSGINVHYGTPVNPAAPGRLPGGSSSGSAAVVAGGLCDLALGTDTSGSIRLPAAWCGVYGYRPTHGRIPTRGVVPLAPRLDTVGMVARDPAVLSAAARLFAPPPAAAPAPFHTLLVAVDAFAYADAPVCDALFTLLMRLRGHFAAVRAVEVHGGDPLRSLEAHLVLVDAGFHSGRHQSWIDDVHPSFGPDVGSRLRPGATPPSAPRVAHAQRVRRAMRARLRDILAPGAVLALPTTYGLPPRVDTPLETLCDIELRAILQGCLASLTGTPQVSVPWAESDGLPVGLSLLADRQRDDDLLALACTLHSSLGPRQD